jgi:2-isopropylmalate synthase
MSAQSAFATKAGIHASAMAKEPRTYEHVPPEAVGNRAASGVRPGGPLQPSSPNSTASASTSAKDDPRIDRLLADRQGARGARLCL